MPVQGCRHILRCEVHLATTARLVWREEVVLGRTGERPGGLDAELRVVRGGVPALHQQLVLDGTEAQAHRAGSLLAGARAVGSLLVAGPGVPEHEAHLATPELRGAMLELEAAGGSRAPPRPRPHTCAGGSTTVLPRSLRCRAPG